VEIMMIMMIIMMMFIRFLVKHKLIYTPYMTSREEFSTIKKIPTNILDDKKLVLPYTAQKYIYFTKLKIDFDITKFNSI
jgi:hypothetical protein